MKEIDALIITPNAREDIYQELHEELAAIETPIWAGLIANSLRKKKYSVAILDCEAESLKMEQVITKIPEYNPRLIVIVIYGQQPSASTQSMHSASALCSLIKESYPNSKVLLVGGHVSALPERTVLEEKADFACQGEGPYTISALLEIDMNDKSKYSKVPGLWYKEDGKAVFSHVASVVPQRNMESDLPGIAYDLLPMSNYRAHNWQCFNDISTRGSYASLYTSLGCPFHCSFCCINAPFSKPGFRYWDPNFTIKQFDILAEKYNIKNIKIADEMFVLKENHFVTLCNLLKERNYGFNIWAYARVDTVKPKYLEVLKSAGINWLALGIESGSKYVRDGVSKGRFDIDDIKNTVNEIKNAGINIIGNYIFGLPDDDFETMKETLNLSMELNCEMANFYCAMAYPGSELYKLAVANNKALPKNWIGYSQFAYETLPLNTNHLTSGEVLAFRDYAWKKYFTNPEYLKLIKDKFGDETCNYIVEMSKHKLKRKYAANINEGIFT